MTKKTTADLQASSAVRFPNQTLGQITYASCFDQHNDNADSLLNHLDLTATSTDDGKGLVVDYASRLIVVGASYSVNNLAWTNITGNTTVTATAIRYTVSPAADTTITMHASPADGYVVEIKVLDATTYTVTVDGNGTNMDDNATFELRSWESVLITYNATAGIWIIT